MFSMFVKKYNNSKNNKKNKNNEWTKKMHKLMKHISI